MTTLAEIKVILGAMSVAYPNYTAPNGTEKAFLMILEDIPFDALEAAGKIYMSEDNAFFPTPGQLRTRAINVLINRRGLPTPYDAWEEAIDHCRRGTYKDYTHPLIERAVKQIGVPYWQNMLTDDEMATRAQFFKIYQALLDRELEDIKTLPSVRAVEEKYADLSPMDIIKQLADSKSVKIQVPFKMPVEKTTEEL